MSDHGWDLYLHGHATGEGAPVVGDHAAFQDATTWFRGLAEDARDVTRSLGGLSRGTGDGFRGESADAFGQLVDDALERLRVVPLIAEDVASTLGSHATELAGLQDDAAVLLARAETAWQDAVHAEHGRDESEGRLRAVRAQLEVLEAAEEDGAGSVDALRSQAWQFERELTSFRARAADARRDLDAIATTHADLRGREERLDARTADALREQQLWGLKDPAAILRLGQGVIDGVANIAEGVGGFFADTFAALVTLGSALLQGDWQTAVAALNELVTRLSTILLVVAVIVAAVLLVVGTKGAAVPALLQLKSGLKVASLATSAVKLRTSSIMYGNEIERLDGTEVTAGDVAWDAAGVASSAVGVSKAGTPDVGEKSSSLGTWIDRVTYTGKGQHARNAAGLREVGLVTVQRTGHHASELAVLETAGLNAVDLASRTRAEWSLVRDGWRTWQGDTERAASRELGEPCALPDRVRADVLHVDAGPKALSDPAVPHLVSTGLHHEER